MQEINIIEITSEIGAGTRGASLGVEALKVAALNKKSNLFSAFSRMKIPNQNEFLFKKSLTSKAKRIEPYFEQIQDIASEVNSTLNKNKFPFLLSGDHSTAAGTLAGIKQAYPNDKVGVIWIDAHADLHSPYTTPSGNIHGMPLAIASRTDNKENAINEITGKTYEYWEKSKKLSGREASISLENLIFVGLRSTEKPEDYIIDKNNVPNLTVDRLRSKGTLEIANQCLEYLNDCDKIYISFDVDSMDPELSSYGTGTPVPNGLKPEEAKELIQHLIQNPKICCFEIVEINPCLDDKKNRMAEIALDIIENTITHLQK